ncbi:MAG: NmrA family NAD(P)-binding protein [Bryobacterales bacterium]|nr:NmrA family NAD(P)-binding protein [Bryobacterales bacterium]
MNLVVGATGMVGTEICRLIAASGRPVKALVRASSAAAKVENLKASGRNRRPRRCAIGARSKPLAPG